MSSDSIRVLLVDDDEDVARTAAAFLERENDRFRVETAAGAGEGLDRLAEADFDCVVSDYGMPGRDGIDFLEAIRAEDEELPFVLFTGEGSEGVASEAISAGVTDYVRKGTDTERYELLANRIENAVSQHRTQRWLRTVLESMPDGIVLVDDDGTIRQVNERIEEMFGYDREELVGEPVEVLVPERFRDDHEAHRDRFFADPETRPMGAGLDLYGRTASGEELPVEISLSPVGIGSDRKAIAVVRDVTEHERRKRQLRTRKEQIEALHDVATDIGACDAASEVYERMVDAAEDVLDFDIAIADAAEGDALVPRAVSSDLPEEEYYDETPIDADDNLAAEAYRTGEPSVVADVRELDITPASTEFRSALTVPIGEHGIFQTVDRDAGTFDEDDLELAELLVAPAETRLARLEDRRQLRERTERLREKNDRLERFASIVSHDLQNPLNVAQGRLDLAREECDSDHLDDVAAALERSQGLIDDLLTLAREGEELGDLQPVDLATAAENCWGNVETADASLVVDAERTIRADPGRFKQLLENLIGNAVEHGGPDVTVTVGDLDGGFYVADDGEGIPEDERDRVFESGYSTSEDGTGLGLDIVEQVADAHGWVVTVTESAAGGARFEITGVDEA